MLFAGGQWTFVGSCFALQGESPWKLQ